ncbi:MAG: single-stranded DNA-binding protein [Candidatus Dormibacteraceae bacterium]
MYNRVILIGHLAGDPEVRVTQSGTPVANFRLATNTYAGTDEAGQRKEVTDFHTIVVFGKPAETAKTYLEKGPLVHVEGKLHHRAWEGSDGQKRTTSEIVADSFLMLGSRPTTEGG